MTKEKLFIVIITYNGMQWIEKCLNSCNGNSIIVVDNASTDNTVAFIRENYPKIKLIAQDKNLGFGAANNLGIAYALKQECDYVFLLNQDTYLQKNAIEKLIEAHQENPEFGILSPIHLNGIGDKLDRNFSYYISYDKNPNFYFDAINSGLKTIYEVPFVNAAAWLLPKHTLENIGGFDPIFFHYGEDDNYCQRVLFHKLKIGIVAVSFVNHDRETRTHNIKETKESKLLKLERSFKLNWANINEDNLKEITTRKNSLKKKVLKFKIKFKFSVAKRYQSELKLIERIESEIIKSKEINCKLGSHYIR